MKVKSIPSSWISRDGLRLDCNPYMSGALEARIHLEKLACRKQRLADLTRGHDSGIYNGPHFSRNYLGTPEKENHRPDPNPLSKQLIQTSQAELYSHQ